LRRMGLKCLSLSYFPRRLIERMDSAMSGSSTAPVKAQTKAQMVKVIRTATCNGRTFDVCRWNKNLQINEKYAL
jgi:hypothetical protein